MRYLGVLVSVAVAALLAVGASTAAPRAEQITIPINDSFEATFLSNACGFAVFIDTVANIKVTLIRDNNGLIVREIDRAGGGRIIYRSPDTGKSFSFAFQSSSWVYPGGAKVGSAAIVTFHGLEGHVPGFVASDAGLFKFLGVVTGFDEFGIAIVDFVEVIADRGHTADGVVPAICAALAP